MNKLSAVICDIDGTVAIHEGIRGHYEYDKVSLDVPNRPIIDVVTSYVGIAKEFGGKTVLIVMTGRPASETVTADTSAWLLKNGIYYDSLIMRPEFLEGTTKPDYRKDYIVKEELYRTHVEPFYDVDVVFDDRTQVVQMWRRIGLTCLQVADGNF